MSDRAKQFLTWRDRQRVRDARARSVGVLGHERDCHVIDLVDEIDEERIALAERNKDAVREGRRREIARSFRETEAAGVHTRRAWGFFS